jgi:hypothetical protein
VRRLGDADRQAGQVVDALAQPPCGDDRQAEGQDRGHDMHAGQEGAQEEDDVGSAGGGAALQEEAYGALAPPDQCVFEYEDRGGNDRDEERLLKDSLVKPLNPDLTIK